jgi:hypothetical protein
LHATTPFSLGLVQKIELPETSRTAAPIGMRWTEH